MHLGGFVDGMTAVDYLYSASDLTSWCACDLLEIRSSLNRSIEDFTEKHDKEVCQRIQETHGVSDEILLAPPLT